MENCGKLADKIDERNEYVGDKKWADVKDKDLKEKLQYWNDKYETWSCEEGKMRALVCKMLLAMKLLDVSKFLIVFYVDFNCRKICAV